MAVEQAAFVTCNSFRLLEVFNRHFKLKKEEACKTKSGHRRGSRQESGRDRKREGDRNKQGYMEKTHTQKKKQIKEIRLLASSQISAFPLKSVSVAAKSING